MQRPNVVLVLVDDMGFSDIGCYGGEIDTPHIDRLAQHGVRFSQFYNTARCSPSRASLLTGLHPHQAGIGVLTNDDGPRGYRGTINRNCATMAEVLRAAGYATCLSGKWHLASDMHKPNDAWPTRRGFERFFGTLTGCGSFFDPGTLTRGETNAEHEADRPDFYYTDAITDEAVDFVHQKMGSGSNLSRGSAGQNSDKSEPDPIYLYVAYTAPHWPLHARDEDLAKYRGKFDEGWDVLRVRRLERLRAAGILDESAPLSDRDPTQPAWNDAEYKDWQARRMEAYAAQIDRMDKGVGRIIDALEAAGRLDDTLFVFLSDNGASDEVLPLVKLERFKTRSDILRVKTRDGRDVKIGNEPDIVPGGEDTYSSYGRAWANLSNTPFRYYKRWVHEGGIATPLIVHWPNGGLKVGSVVKAPCQLVDVLPTVLDATGAPPLQTNAGHAVLPLEGRSLLPALRGQPIDEATQYWEHTGNAAIRRGNWKLVRDWPKPWELYDLAHDRTELHDVAAQNPDIVGELSAAWQAWADRVGVLPWQVTLDIYAERGQPEREAQG